MCVKIKLFSVHNSQKKLFSVHFSCGLRMNLSSLRCTEVHTRVHSFLRAMVWSNKRVRRILRGRSLSKIFRCTIHGTMVRWYCSTVPAVLICFWMRLYRHADSGRWYLRLCTARTHWSEGDEVLLVALSEGSDSSERHASKGCIIACCVRLNQSDQRYHSIRTHWWWKCVGHIGQISARVLWMFDREPYNNEDEYGVIIVDCWSRSS